MWKNVPKSGCASPGRPGMQERCGGALAKAGRSLPTPPTSAGRRVAVVDEEGREIGEQCAETDRPS
jgi:hypothetical protein